MKLLNTEKLQSLAGYSYSCECGQRHMVSTEEIVFEHGGLKCLAAICTKLCGVGGKILVLFSDRSQRLKAAIKNALVGFVLICEVLPHGAPRVEALNRFSDIPENVRLIIGVGGGGAVDSAKYLACAHGKACVVVPDAITCDAFLSPSAVLYKNGFKEIYKTTPPRALVADLDIILNLDEDDTAAAFGCLMAKHISLFDWKVSNILCGEKYCEGIYSLSQSLIGRALESAEGARRRELPALALLAEQNLRSGLYMQLAGGSRISCGAETHVEHALEMLLGYEERELMPYGSNLMLCAAFVAKVYKLALEREFGSALPAADNTLRLECISEFFGAPPEAAIRRIRPILPESVLQTRVHRLSEFRQELLTEITAINVSLLTAFKYFKRIFLDSGYRLNHYLDPADFKLALPLAPDIREKYTLLTMLKDMGLLDKYLPSIR